MTDAHPEPPLASAPSALTTRSVEEASDYLKEHLLLVVGRHLPQIEPVLRGVAPPSTLPNYAYEMGRVLQAQGIVFQLISIAEQAYAMRRRRKIERERGHDHLLGTFDQALTGARDAGVTAEEIREQLRSLRIRPVITAHPTEAKRISILEKNRAVYLLLRELESTRWTDRERNALNAQLRNQIELLFLTGDLHLEKPKVEHEVSWGKHFFRETIFDLAPDLLPAFEHALEKHYPGESFEVTPFFQFGSWIGGDRDGNPYVTNEVTRRTMRANALTALNYYHKRVESLAGMLSISRRAADIPQMLRAELDKRLDALKDASSIRSRNEPEPYRQFASLILYKLDQTLAATRGEEPKDLRYNNADELIADLRVIEDSLCSDEGKSSTLAEGLVRPLRRAVEIFRFSTVRLDLRENTTRTTNALCDLWHATREDEPAAPDSAEWRAWLDAQLQTPPLSADERERFSRETRDTIEMFELVAELQSRLDREAFGSFILSMTHSVADVLGAYVLAKEAGLVRQSSKGVYCTLPIVPLFET
ncbi:MAG TPA: phosphoenolpyruvate carboxylase, partial [Polyangiaceae bacterium]